MEAPSPSISSIVPNLKIQKVDPPKGTLIDGCFARVDYADAYQAIIPAELFVDVDSFARSIFRSTPWWVKALMAARNCVVSVIGLKTSDFTDAENENIDLQTGSSIRGFHVFDRTESEILLGLDDSHLDFRLSLLLEAQGEERRVVVATIVRFNNWVGRAYFIPVKPGHKIIVKALLRQAIKEQNLDFGES
jgi:hypothetical protein